VPIKLYGSGFLFAPLLPILTAVADEVAVVFLIKWHRFKPAGDEPGSNNVSVLLLRCCSVDLVTGRH